MTNLVSVGQPIGHVEGPDKVTGRARYTADITLPGMLWGKCLRSPFPHARISTIDVSRAKELPGVHAVITGADLPDRRIGRFFLDMPVLARAMKGVLLEIHTLTFPFVSIWTTLACGSI